MSTNFIKKSGGSLEDIDIRCPNCKSSNVTLFKDEYGYYDVLECKKCGYKNTKNRKSE
ncbi:MAG: hypothetical protein QXW97_02470 [Candidatus Pacearchaeota archaeon]